MVMSIEFGAFGGAAGAANAAALWFDFWIAKYEARRCWQRAPRPEKSKRAKVVGHGALYLDGHRYRWVQGRVQRQYRKDKVIFHLSNVAS
jgi:hypothetical protein